MSYYLYIKGSEDTFQDEKAIAPIASLTRLNTKYATLIAKADLTGEKFTFDRNPPGKVNARDLAQHVLDFDNPHGDKLTQDELFIRKHLTIGEEVDLELDTNGKEYHIPVSRLVSVLTGDRKIEDFVSGGCRGTLLTGNGKIVFANVVRTDNIDRAIGDITIGFYGLDPDVKSEDQIVVRNSSDEIGIALRAMIFCE
jgi:hypothetical protein